MALALLRDCEASASVAGPGRPVPHEQRRGRRILVADSDPAMRGFVRLLLECEGYDVLEATNGRQAVATTLKEEPDLLLIDPAMPDTDGYQVIRRVRRVMSLAMMPIVVLTAQSAPGVERRVRDLGADDCIRKPFDPVRLLAAIDAAFLSPRRWNDTRGDLRMTVVGRLEPLRNMSSTVVTTRRRLRLISHA